MGQCRNTGAHGAHGDPEEYRRRALRVLLCEFLVHPKSGLFYKAEPSQFPEVALGETPGVIEQIGINGALGVLAPWDRGMQLMVDTPIDAPLLIAKKTSS